MLKTQYTSHSFDTATLVVLFSGSKILYSIRTVSEATISNNDF